MPSLARRLPSVFVTAALLCSFVASPSRAQSGECGHFDSTWAAIQKVIFEGKGCTQNACHGSSMQGGLDLRPTVAYANLVSVWSPAGQQFRVQPGGSRDSFLYRKLAAATLGWDLMGQGSPMPNGLPALSTDELEAIRLWIQYGASDTGAVAGTQDLLGSCLPPAEPPRIRALAPPLFGTGVQLHAPPWQIPAHEEDEVCYATYYDLEAGGDGQPLSANKLVMKGGGAAARRFKFSGRFGSDLASLGDPTLLGAKFRIAGGQGEGDSREITLPPEGWHKRSNGFQYSDAKRAQGGVRSVQLIGGSGGGTLKASGGGKLWEYARPKKATTLTVTLAIGDMNLCARFTPRGHKGNSVLAKASQAPASCSMIPEDARVPCPAYWGGPTKSCFYFNRTELTQEPNSHHSIIHIYKGVFPATDPGFHFTCHGGADDKKPCDPSVPGVCGADGICHGDVLSRIACINYGPPDYSRGFSVAGTGSDNAPSVGGSQQPYFNNPLPTDVFGIFPTRGVVVWNSHAFNLTEEPTANQQWWNIYFGGAENRRYPARGIFDSTDIFVQNVPPFEEREYCRTITMGVGTRVYYLSSHTHQRGRQFRVWGPGIAAPCRSTIDDPGACLPEAGQPVLVTTQYNDPAQVRFDPPLVLDSPDPAQRRFKFCSLYDNGATDPAKVKRNSSSPLPPQFGALAPGGPCYLTNFFPRDNGIACLDGPHKGQLCAGDDRVCDSAPGANDGKCDACPLLGGVTTEDEMFILLGSYYCVPGTACEAGSTL